MPLEPIAELVLYVTVLRDTIGRFSCPDKLIVVFIPLPDKAQHAMATVTVNPYISTCMQFFLFDGW